MDDVANLFENAARQQTAPPAQQPAVDTHEAVAQFFENAPKVAANQSSAPQEPAYDASLFRQRVGRDPEPYELQQFKEAKGRGWPGDPAQAPRFTIGQAAVGAGEDALSLGTGAIAAPFAGVTYIGSGGDLEAAKKTQSALTYVPRTEAGKAGIKGVGDVASAPAQLALAVADKIDPSGQLSAAMSDVGERTGVAAGAVPVLGAARAALPAIGRGLLSDPEAVAGRIYKPAAPGVEYNREGVAVNPLGSGSATTAEQAAARAAGPSAGAAGAAPNIANISPDLRQAIAKSAQQNGGAVNPQALTRHIEADSLPVKMQLTEGQATQDPTLISEERNTRGKNSEMIQRLNNQNQQLGENIQALRDSVGPDVYSTNQVEHGQALIDAYKAKDAAAQTDIAAKYQALKDANGGTFPVDAKQLFSNASADLHDQLLFDHAPTPVMSTLQRLADNGNMTFENFESLRTNLARIQRTATDGNERAAAGVIRNSMEQLPLAAGAQNLKALADTARSAARSQFDALEADPAYKAAVNDTVSPDRFVQRFVVGGNKDDVAAMRQNFEDNPNAQQTMGVAALDHLRNSARLDDQGNGNFSHAGYNKALQGLQPKLRSLVSPNDAETLHTLGNVARYSQAQPAGSFVNNSNTLVGALAQHGKSIAEGAVNAKTGGIGGTVAFGLLRKSGERKAVAKSLEAGAGLGRLDLARPSR
jgi:hypothetical protein